MYFSEGPVSEIKRQGCEMQPSTYSTPPLQLETQRWLIELGELHAVYVDRNGSF